MREVDPPIQGRGSQRDVLDLGSHPPLPPTLRPQHKKERSALPKGEGMQTSAARK